MQRATLGIWRYQRAAGLYAISASCRPSRGLICISLGSFEEAATAEMKVNPLSQDKQWFVDTLRRLGYTEAADSAARELPDPVPMEELKKFADRYNISRDEVMSQMGGSP